MIRENPAWDGSIMKLMLISAHTGKRLEPWPRRCYITHRDTIVAATPTTSRHTSHSSEIRTAGTPIEMNKTVTRSKISRLELVYPPISNQEAVWLQDDPEVEREL